MDPIAQVVRELKNHQFLHALRTHDPGANARHMPSGCSLVFFSAIDQPHLIAAPKHRT